MNGMVPWIAAAVVVVALTAYALVSVSSDVDDFEDPARWDEL